MLLGVIPARGGSKGIRRKNLMPFAGMPLIYWSIRDARESKLLRRFVVTTEDHEIADVSRSFGAEVLDRPVELAKDDTTTIAVLQHVFESMPEVSAVLLMQPTNPIRVDNLIDRVIEGYNSNDVDSVATGYMCRFWEWGSREVNLPRQVDPGYFYDDGNLYILSREDVVAGRWCGRKQLPIYTEAKYHFEIDEPIEAVAAEAVFYNLQTNGVENQEKNLADFLPMLKLLVFDFDGVLTDNKVMITEEGKEAVVCDRADSWGLSLLKRKNVPMVICSTEKNPVVRKRAEKLNIEVIYGINDKLKTFKGFCEERSISLDNVAYVGNDLNDLEIMSRVGFPIAPAKSDPKVKKIARYIIPKDGGDGAVRHLADEILMSL